jgi:hypothetical protein
MLMHVLRRIALVALAAILPFLLFALAFDYWVINTASHPSTIKKVVAGKKADFAALVADHAKQQAAQLPPCPAGTPLPDVSSFDAFSASCLPRGVTPDQVSQEVGQALLTNKDFLSKPILTAETLKDDKTGQPLFESGKIKDAPHYYQWAKRTPLILAMLAILVLAGIVFLSPTWQQGLRRAGIVLLVIGLLMIVFAFGLSHAHIQNKIATAKLNGVNSEQLLKNVRNVVRDITDLVSNNYWFFGGLYTSLGVGSIVVSEVFKRRAQPIGAPRIGAPKAERDTPEN